MYSVDLLNRRADRFVLWLPGVSLPSPPELVLGVYDQGGSGAFSQLVRQALTPADQPGLWELDPGTLSPRLPDGVYRYWFWVGDAQITDPVAFAVDYTHIKVRDESQHPPGVIKYRDGKLWPCDVDGSEPGRPSISPIDKLPANNHLVIYELPTSWAKGGNDERGVDVDVGTFSDVRALFDQQAKGDRFASISAVSNGAILAELGINALELLPAADAKAKDAWGYATAHYFAPDFDLGTASELVSLVETLNSQNLRFFADVVMAFGHDSYATIAFDPFHIDADKEPDNPDSYQSHAVDQKRVGWGGVLWRYMRDTVTYDPESGQTVMVHPSWAFHKAHLARWMTDFGLSGLRLDSINNVGNWDFVRAFKERAWGLYNARYGPQADPSKFLVIGEELSLPVGMVHQGCLNALWNETWLYRLRSVLLGQPLDHDTFEGTIRKLANCTLDTLNPAFTDGAQAIIYVTSHDIEGWHKNRLYNFCKDNGIWDIERRAKLAFVLLLTSVGIPMIFAGEEFADQEDQSLDMSRKQDDPVNYSRKNDGGWRQALFAHNANLVRFRISCPALGTNNTDFFHVDESRGGKIMAWRRGPLGGSGPVVVVANFTDDDTPGSEYDIPDWPDKDAQGWREVTQGRDVPAEWVGREPLMAWEAKVYTYWRP